MGLASNITRRTGSSRYYVRAWVPGELQAALRKRELWKSLGTSDPKEAKRLARGVLMRWERDFDTLRAKRALSDHELQTAIWSRYTELVQSDERKRQALPTDDDLNDIWEALVVEFGEFVIDAWRILEGIAGEHETDKEKRASRLATLKAEIAKGETKSVAQVMKEIVTTRSLALPPRSVDERKLAHGLQRAEIAALHIASERDEGDFSGMPTDALIKPPSGTAPLVAAPGESIMELFDVFALENPNSVTALTLNQSRTVVDLFSQFVGRHFPAARIGKKEVREWKAALREYPVKATETKEFRGLDFRQTVEANRKIGKRPISSKTLNRYLAALGTYCNWLVAHGYLEHVPTSGMFIKIDKNKSNVLPYNPQQLEAIFRSPLFTGCRVDGKEYKPGNVIIRDHRYWLPLMSLYSGARMGELCQLLTSDIRQQHGHWVFSITQDDDPAKHLKNKGSQRIVPVHPALIELGLLDYHKRMKAQKEKWLFPEIKPNSVGSRAGHFSDFYGDYIARIGVKTDKSVNFHSFRHGFADAARRAGYLDHDFAFLLGHTQNTITGRYGALPEGDLARRVEVITRVEYPGLDLSSLRPGPSRG